MPTQKRFLARKSAKASAAGEIYLYDEIGGWGVSSKEFAQALGALSAEGATALDIYVNSPGGDVFEGVAIYNQLRRFSGAKTIHIDGLAASIASIIALAGDRVVCAPNAMVMIHEPWTFVGGNAPALRECADQLDKVAEVMLGTYAERTKSDPADIRKWMAAETWMTAEEAKARGFVHEVGSGAPAPKEGDGAKASLLFPMLDRFKNTPAALRQQMVAALSTLPATDGMVPNATDQHTDNGAMGAQNEKEPLMKSILIALGLAETTPEAEAVTLAAKLRELQTITGKTSPSEAIGVVQAWKNGAEQAATLAAKVHQLEGEKLDREVTGLVDGAIKDGKSTPAQRESLLGMGRKDAATLKAFLEAAPVISAVTTEVKPPASGTGPQALTPEEESVTRQLNLDKKNFAAHKAAIG